MKRQAAGKAWSYMSRRVVVTGMGAITPVGLGTAEFWNAVKEGKHGFAPITKFDVSEYKCKIAAEVKGFDAKEYMDFKAAKRMEVFSQYAVAAAAEALADSGLSMEKEDPYLVGCAIGSGIGSLQAMEREHTKLLEKGPNRINPLMVPLMISNMAAGNVSIQFGLKGKSINSVTACATGTNTIGEAYRAIQYGEADVMVAGGTEGCITPVGIAGFTALTALSTVDNPDECSLPFDKRRSGFVMGEGAAVVVLEELSHALARGVKIYGEIAGYGCASDAYHITSPEESGAGAARAMENAIKDAGLKPEDILYINAHGTGTPMNDVVETAAIKKALGEEAARRAQVSSTKSMTGHMLGAAGAVEAIACLLALEEGILPPTINLLEPDEACDLCYLPNTAVRAEVTLALSNSLGFGGHNACLAFRKVV